MSDLQATAVALLVIVPSAVIAVVAMLRGYHVWVHLYRPDKEDHDRPDR